MSSAQTHTRTHTQFLFNRPIPLELLPYSVGTAGRGDTGGLFCPQECKIDRAAKTE